MSELLQMSDQETKQMWDNLSFQYNDVRGMLQLRQEISSMYNGVVDPETEILVMAPQEGIYLSMLATLSDDDVIVVTHPGYQSLHEVGRSLGCKIRYWRPRKNGIKWQFYVEDLQKLLHGAKMLVVNFPHNPTGALLQQQDMDKLADLCEQQGILIFSDEMYRGLEHDRKVTSQGESQLPSMLEMYDNAIVLSGVSKTLSLPGLRIGWIISKNQAVIQRITELKDYTTICSSAPSEVLSLIALRNRNAIMYRNVELIVRNKELAQKVFAQKQQIFEQFETQAGSIAFPKFRTSKTNEVVDEILNIAREQMGILLLPGSLMVDENQAEDDIFRSHFRLGLGRKNFQTCISVFHDFINENSDKILKLLN